MHDVRKCLELLAGTWAGQEEIAASRWGEGGSATASVAARLDLGGHVLIQDYSAQRDGKQWLRAHAVLAYDQQSAALSLYWFDSMGFVPAAPAPGEWDGRALRFVRSSPRGQTRHTYVPAGPDSYQLILESSFDSGASWAPVVSGRYLRVGA